MIPALIILAVTIGFGAVLYVCHKISEQRTPNNPLMTRKRLQP